MVCPPAGEIDLWTGVIRYSDGSAKEQFKAWGPRLGAIATALYMTRIIGDDAASRSLGLLEMLLIWPSWLSKARDIRDILTWIHPVRHRIAKALRPYGYDVPKAKKRSYVWSLIPLPGYTGPMLIITAERAVQALRDALHAFGRCDYAEAMRLASDALSHCHDSQMAWLIMGKCLFSHGVQVDRSLALMIAEHLRRYQQALKEVVTLLPSCLRNTRGYASLCMAAGPELIERCEETLQDYADIISAAGRFLGGLSEKEE